MSNEATLSKRATIVSWIAQLTAAVILGQTLFFKFSGAPESVHIFGTLGVEPWGRYLAAITELAAVILLVVPRAATITLGALLAAGVMVGAIGSHLTVLGIEVQGDGGTLFVLALIVLAASLTVLALRKKDLPFVR